MAVIEYSVSEAVGATEHSLTTDSAYSSGTLKTDVGVLQAHLDLSDMAGTDELQITVYIQVQSGGPVLIFARSNPNGPQSEAFSTPSVVVKHGWEVAVKAIVGTITVNGSVLVASL